MHRTGGAGSWLRNRVELARYAHVPLSDLQGDPTVAVADVLFARNLRDANHLLWMLDESLPDLGGWLGEGGGGRGGARGGGGTWVRWLAG